MPPTSEQWLELHARCLDTLRAVLNGLPEDALHEEDPDSPQSIGSILAHAVMAEAYWLAEVGIEPLFAIPAKEDWSGRVFTDTLDRIEEQYRAILDERPGDPSILFGLSRVCQHALYHLAGLARLRRRREPEWRLPKPPEAGSWEGAADYLTRLLINETPRDSHREEMTA